VILNNEDARFLESKRASPPRPQQLPAIRKIVEREKIGKRRREWRGFFWQGADAIN
jgi:hypothetical protein